MIYPTCEFQSKQQLMVFSSRRYTVDPLRKTCNSPNRNPGDILTNSFSNTHSAASVKQLCCNEKQACVNSPFKPQGTPHLMSIKFLCAKYQKTMALTEEYFTVLSHVMEVAAGKEPSVL